MSAALIELMLFAAKAVLIVMAILFVLIVFFALMAKAKHKTKGRLLIKNINDQYDEMAEAILTETLNKKDFKYYLKSKKQHLKLIEKNARRKIYVLDFQGDIKASSVASLSKEITAIVSVATPQDEVVLRLESAGGMVHAYGLATAQLLRLKAHHIPLTVVIDKMAASGGYMMACVADKILCAPYALIGSIGVVVQLPNFHRLLKEKNIDFELLTAGEFKRTLTLFGENTEAGREKMRAELELIHRLFKNLIHEHRSEIDIQQVATGEHWPGVEAIQLKLVDRIETSDQYLQEKSKDAALYSIRYETKKNLLHQVAQAAQAYLSLI